MGGNDATDFKDMVLKKHNELRSRHKDTGSLTWCPELATASQKWADELGKLNVLKHASDLQCGENIFCASTTGDYTAKELGEKCCDKWYSEIENFDFAKKGKKSEKGVIGHFTQTVWKASQKVGAGYCKIKDGKFNKFFVVARYTPTGNYIGQEAENVMDLK